MKRLIFAFYLLSALAFLTATDVGGIITQDTTWSPEYNPYHVLNHITVNPNVTLTILPGTEIYVQGGISTGWGDGDDFWWSTGTAKMFYVRGSIVAIGTEEQPILFDRLEDTPDYRWGGIAIKISSTMTSYFEHCTIQYTYLIYHPDVTYHSAIYADNGKISVKYCTFFNNYVGLSVRNLQSSFVLYGNTFEVTEPYPSNCVSNTSIGLCMDDEHPCRVTVARNTFRGYTTDGYRGIDNIYGDYLFNNNLYLDILIDDNRPVKDGPPEQFNPELRKPVPAVRDTMSTARNSYGNLYYHCNDQANLGAQSYAVTDTAFCRRNRLIGSEEFGGVMGAGGIGKNHLADNYIYHGKGLGFGSTTDEGEFYIYNNFLDGSHNHWGAIGYGGYDIDQADNVRIFNNVIMNCGKGFNFEGGPLRVFNNLLVNINPCFDFINDCSLPLFENNIFLHCMSSNYPGFGNITLRNNFFSDSLQFQGGQGWDPFTDLGGNLIGVDPMFTDSLNGDYTLLPGSPLIDAGVNTAYLFDFDRLYRHRIIDGNNDGTATVDIGPWEYGSTYRGGIEGSVIDDITGEPVDCVKISIHDRLPEFSDSSGYFKFDLPAGTYRIKAERWDIPAAYVAEVTVTDGQISDVAITVHPEVSAQEIAVPRPDFALGNYPNPFNPKTNIRFTLPTANRVCLDVYNIRGQKVRNLVNEKLEAGRHVVTWDGKNNNGRGVASGVYFYRLEANGKTAVKKMLLLK